MSRCDYYGGKCVLPGGHLGLHWILDEQTKPIELCNHAAELTRLRAVESLAREYFELLDNFKGHWQAEALVAKSDAIRAALNDKGRPEGVSGPR